MYGTGEATKCSFDFIAQTTFGAVSVNEMLLYEDADYAGLGIAVYQGSAAERLGLTHDMPVRIEPA